MPRNRVIPASEALFVSANATGAATGVNTVLQLNRVQSINYSDSISRTPVEQYGQQAPIDQVILDPVDVALDFSYLATNVVNESRLGLVVDGSAQAISGFLTKTTDQKNYYVLTVPEGEDAVGGDSVGTNYTRGIGNGFLSNYTFEAAVGSFPTASVTVEALNSVIYAGKSGTLPSVNVSGYRITGAGLAFSLPTTVSGLVGQATALRPGDVFLNLVDPLFGTDVSEAHIQNISLSVDLAREPLNQLGSAFPFSREPTFPINITLSVDANVGDLVAGSLNDILCNDAKYDLSVGVRKPNCSGQGAVAIQHTIRGAKLDSQSYSSSIGSSKTVSLQWTAQIGGPRDLAAGWFVSGTMDGASV